MSILKFPSKFPETLKPHAETGYEYFRVMLSCDSKPERVAYFLRFIGNVDNKKNEQVMNDFWDEVEKRIPFDSPMDGTPTVTVDGLFASFSWAFYTWHSRPQISKKVYREQYEQAYSALIKLNSIIKRNALIKAQMDGYYRGYLAKKLELKRVPSGINFRDLIENIITRVDSSGRDNELSYEFLPAHLFANSTRRSPKKVHFAAFFEELVQRVYGKRENAKVLKIIECVMPEFSGMDYDSVRGNYKKTLNKQ